MVPIKRCQMLMVGCQHLVQHSRKRSTARRRCSETTLSTPRCGKKRLRGMFLSGLSLEESQAEEDVLSSISTSLKQSARLHRLHHESRQNEMISSVICNANLDLRWWGCLIGGLWWSPTGNLSIIPATTRFFRVFLHANSCWENPAFHRPGYDPYRSLCILHASLAAR